MCSGRDVNCPHAADMVYTLKERRYYEQIERAYDFASKLLLELLMKEKELLARIRWGCFFVCVWFFVVLFIEIYVGLSFRNFPPARNLGWFLWKVNCKTKCCTKI